MTQRLVWNFEFTHTKILHLPEEPKHKSDLLKWEARFFWQQQDIVSLTLIDNALLQLSNYQHKQKKDVYYLIPKNSFNIKKRRDELLYKPLIKKRKHSCGFGPKIKLNELSKDSHSIEHSGIDIVSLMTLLQLQGVEVLVKKESFSYKFPVHPHIKLELSRIEINQQIYFSVCVEGKSQQSVELISRCIVGQQPCCNYVRFLKKIIKN